MLFVCQFNIQITSNLQKTRFFVYIFFTSNVYLNNIYLTYGVIMLLVVGGIKGGSGKTTIATNLCQMRSYEGFKVLLIDADDQKSSYDWSVQRDEIGLGLASLKTKSKPFVTVCMSGTSGKSIYANILKMLSDYDDIIVDAGGRNTESQRAALSLADKFLLPFKPSSIDIWTIGQVDRLLNDCVNPKLKTYAVVNQGDY